MKLRMRNINEKVENTIEVIDGVGIVPNGCYFSKEDLEAIAFGRTWIVSDGRTTLVKNDNPQISLSNGRYFATTDEVKQMALGKIKYAD